MGLFDGAAGELDGRARPHRRARIETSALAPRATAAGVVAPDLTVGRGLKRDRPRSRPTIEDRSRPTSPSGED